MLCRFCLPVLLPFLLAWLLAGWLSPAARRLEKRTRIKASVWGTALLLLLLLFLAVLLYVGVRELLIQGERALSHFPVLLGWGEGLLERFCAGVEGLTGIGKEESAAYVRERLLEMQGELPSLLLPGLFGGAVSVGRCVLVLFSGIVVTWISAALFMGDLDQIRKKIREYSWLSGTLKVVRQLKKTTAVYLKAQVLILLLVAAVSTAGFWILGSPYFLILGILLGILDALPIFGTGIVLYPSALVLLIKGKVLAAAGCVLLDLLTTVLREFLEPKLLGGRLGVSPIMILASVYAGFFLYGGWGVLLGPLSFSAVYETGKVWDLWG